MTALPLQPGVARLIKALTRAAANVAIAYETGKPVALLPDHRKGSR